MTTPALPEGVSLRDDLAGVDWPALKARLAGDRFDNGRSADALRRSFESSAVVCMAWKDGAVVGKARALSDGVCNAYVIDVWTDSKLRKRGIGSAMMRRLLDRLPGQHVYLFSDDRASFYEGLGFEAQPVGLSKVVGQWLEAADRA